MWQFFLEIMLLRVICEPCRKVSTTSRIIRIWNFRHWIKWKTEYNISPNFAPTVKMLVHLEYRSYYLSFRLKILKRIIELEVYKLISHSCRVEILSHKQQLFHIYSMDFVSKQNLRCTASLSLSICFLCKPYQTLRLRLHAMPFCAHRPKISAITANENITFILLTSIDKESWPWQCHAI